MSTNELSFKWVANREAGKAVSYNLRNEHGINVAEVKKIADEGYQVTETRTGKSEVELHSTLGAAKSVAEKLLEKKANHKAPKKGRVSKGRKDYTDSLGRTWTWDVEQKKYHYVRKTHEATSEELGHEIEVRQKALDELTAQLEANVLENRLLAQAKKRRLQLSIEHLTFKLTHKSA